MANVDGTREKAIRDSIAEKLRENSEIKNAFSRRSFIRSRKDFYDKLGKVVSDNRTEIRFAEIRFLGYENGDGFPADSDCILQYQIHLFFEYRENRPDASNAEDDFTSAVLWIRNEFLHDQTFATGKTDDDGGLSQPGYAQFGADTFIDVDGFFIDFRLDVVAKATC